MTDNVYDISTKKPMENAPVVASIEVTEREDGSVTFAFTGGTIPLLGLLKVAEIEILRAAQQEFDSTLQ